MFKDKIPYSPEMLSTVTNINIDHIRVGMKVLSDLQMIEKMDTGAIYMTDIQELIGTTSSEAIRKAEYRKKIADEKLSLPDGTMSPNRPPELETEKKKDIEKEISETFSTFWTTYEKKVSKDKCIKLWKKLNKSDRDNCLSITPEYVRCTPEKQYRKNPDTYLRNRSWEDELPSIDSNSNTGYTQPVNKLFD